MTRGPVALLTVSWDGGLRELISSCFLNEDQRNDTDSPFLWRVKCVGLGEPEFPRFLLTQIFPKPEKMLSASEAARFGV